MTKTQKLIAFQFILFLLLLFESLPSKVMAIENTDGDSSVSSNFYLTINNKQKFLVPEKEFLSWAENKYLLKISPKYQSTAENVSYCLNNYFVCDLLRTTRQNYSIKKRDVLIIKKRNITKFLKSVARTFDKNPVDAKLVIDKSTGKVTDFSLGEKGYKIDIERSYQNIVSFLKKNHNVFSGNIPLIVEIIPPKSDSANNEIFGISDLIGEGKSNFSGSTKSRIHNIEVASKKFDGLLIKPGEEFSFIKNLGPVDGEHGYKPELVIKNNRTTPEFGGGICQVSTTTFRAAIYSGLKITARKNHAYPVHYYNPQGFDATVYIPKPDLKFINNTPGYILIKTGFDLEKKELTFKFYGTDDGRKVEVDSPHIISRGGGGAMKTTFTQKVTNSNGNVIINDEFKSNYASPNKYPHPGQVTVLTKKPKDWSKKQWKEYKKSH